MPRDPRKLRVFIQADDLVPDIYVFTRAFPDEEKFGLVSQMRRSSVSIAANIVEGCGRRTTGDYLRFLAIATGSAYDLGYLCGLSGRLGMAGRQQAQLLQRRCGEIAAGLTALIESLEHSDDVGPAAAAARKVQAGLRQSAVKRATKAFEVTLQDLKKRRAR